MQKPMYVDVRIRFEDGTVQEFTLGGRGKLTLFHENITAEYPSALLCGHNRVFICGRKLTIIEEYNDKSVVSNFNVEIE